MIHIEVIRAAEDELRRDVWRFWYYDNWHAIILDGYRRESRGSKRHKFRVDEMYSSLHSRESTI